MIYFHATRADVEEELLDRFMSLEKPRMEEERTALLKVELSDLKYKLPVILKWKEYFLINTFFKLDNLYIITIYSYDACHIFIVLYYFSGPAVEYDSVSRAGRTDCFMSE